MGASTHTFKTMGAEAPTVAWHKCSCQPENNELFIIPKKFTNTRFDCITQGKTINVKK